MIDTAIERAIADRATIDAHRAGLATLRQRVATGWPSSYDLLSVLRRWHGGGVSRDDVIASCARLGLSLSDAP